MTIQHQARGSFISGHGNGVLAPVPVYSDETLKNSHSGIYFSFKPTSNLSYQKTHFEFKDTIPGRENAKYMGLIPLLFASDFAQYLRVRNNDPDSDVAISFQAYLKDLAFYLEQEFEINLGLELTYTGCTPHQPKEDLVGTPKHYKTLPKQLLKIYENGGYPVILTGKVPPIKKGIAFSSYNSPYVARAACPSRIKILGSYQRTFYHHPSILGYTDSFLIPDQEKYLSYSDFEKTCLSEGWQDG